MTGVMTHLPNLAALLGCRGCEKSRACGKIRTWASL
jgi:hypothetical protein